MKLKTFGKTDKGIKRNHNEDSIWIDEKICLYTVADGMGGHKGGKEASSLASTVLGESIRKDLKNLTSEETQNGTEILLKGYNKASQAVYQKSQDETLNLKGMGSTMVCAFYFKNRLFIANVGDSRAYLFRQNKLWQLTEDHSWVSEQVKAGIIEIEEESTIAGKNLITRCIGLEKKVKVDVFEREIRNRDRILLCSDGLTGLVSDEKIADIFKENQLETVVCQCIEEANKTGGNDNISVIVTEFSE